MLSGFSLLYFHWIQLSVSSGSQWVPKGSWKYKEEKKVKKCKLKIWGGEKVKNASRRRETACATSLLVFVTWVAELTSLLPLPSPNQHYIAPKCWIAFHITALCCLLHCNAIHSTIGPLHFATYVTLHQSAASHSAHTQTEHTHAIPTVCKPQQIIWTAQCSGCSDVENATQSIRQPSNAYHTIPSPHEDKADEYEEKRKSGFLNKFFLPFSANLEQMESSLFIW